MNDEIRKLVDAYDATSPLSHARTVPSDWYTDQRIFTLEQDAVFGRSWQVAARVDQLENPGDYITTDIADQPVIVVRGSDRRLRGFFNVCRHHAAAVMTEPEGNAHHMRCPYHGWTYSLNGELKGTPDFNDVCNFDRDENGLLPVEVATWEKWVFARVTDRQPSLNSLDLRGSLGSDLVGQFKAVNLENLHWFDRRSYRLNCNWKVFVDNYLDGGYHVPHLHKGLDTVLDYSNYTITTGERFCLQSSPMVRSNADEIRNWRKGDRALYYWLYPNFMINLYDGVMDTNLVRPLSIDRTEVVFDFYFADASESAGQRNLASVEVADRIQQEDVDICESVQRGLRSRAYTTGRLSVRREAGEHLFHRLLHADLTAAIGSS